ncbi:MAG: hypothetical protein J6Y28_02725 [Acholeplasmatales bacterium]|nr:hypothetical protein [Acholeplasmatales bacterium]
MKRKLLVSLVSLGLLITFSACKKKNNTTSKTTVDPKTSICRTVDKDTTKTNSKTTSITTTNKTTEKKPTTKKTTKQLEKYTVIWMMGEETLETDIDVLEGSKPSFDGTTPIKESTDEYEFSFDGWYTSTGTKLTNDAVVSDDITYYARFTETKREYTIRWVNYDDEALCIRKVEYGEMPIYEGETPTKPYDSENYYEFNGWNKTVVVVTKDTTYKATFISTDLPTINYKVSYCLQDLVNENKYEVDKSVTLSGKLGSLTEVVAPSYEGFSEGVFTQQTIRENLEVNIMYNRLSYNLGIIYDDEIGVLYGDLDYNGQALKYGTPISLSIEFVEDGYGFEGWYINDEFYNDYNDLNITMPGVNTTIEAKFSVPKSRVIIDNKVDGLRLSGVVSGDKYECYKTLNITPINLPDGYYLKWGRSNSTTYTYSDTYSFVVPKNDVTITVELSAYKKESDNKYNYIYFGMYPQSVETDADAVANLNNILDTHPSIDWIPFNKYINVNETNYMWYIDLDLNNDGQNDYRGIYFTGYREDSRKNYDDEEYFQVINGYEKEVVYWFKYEPIKWRILKEEDGLTYIFTESILDNMYFNSLTGITGNSNTVSFAHNGGVGYLNDYRLSDVRQWLLNIFYDDCFSNIEKQMIETTRVKNYGTGEVKDTYDKIFIPSEEELKNVYGINVFEPCYGWATEYGKCMGVYNYVFNDVDNYQWLLRSSSGDPDHIRSYNSCYRSYSVERAAGIRAGLWIDLDKVLNLKPTLTSDGYGFKTDGENSYFERLSKESTFEMYVDDKFNIANVGTIVTGKVLRGVVRVGDTIILTSPKDGYVTRTQLVVLGIEMYSKKLEYATKGDQIGIIFGDQISEDVIEKKSLITLASDENPVDYYEYYMKITPYGTRTKEIENGTYNLELCYHSMNNNAYSSESLNNLSSQTFGAKINGIFDMNFSSVTSIAIDDENEYIIRISPTLKTCFYLGLKGYIYSTGTRVASFEVIALGTDTLKVNEYIQNYNNSNKTLIVYGNCDSYVRYDYMKYTFINSAITFEEALSSIKCEFANPGYRFVRWEMIREGIDYYDSAKSLPIIYASNYRVQAKWEMISNTATITSLDLENGYVLVNINSNFSAGDSINITLADYSTVEATISNIYDLEYNEVEETNYSTDNTKYYLKLSGVDFDKLSTCTIIY